MTIDRNDLLNSILNNLESMDHITVEELPNINLYMDQLTTFMDSRLSNEKRYPEDKVLTKTMINNYAKNNILPPPDRKLYSKQHIVTLIFIYYFKNILSITDIQKVLDPIHEKYFDGCDPDICRIYEEVFALEREEKEHVVNDIKRYVENAKNCFNDIPDEDLEFFQYFAIICQLSCDIYIKKKLVEKMVDELPDRSKKAKELKEAKKKALAKERAQAKAKAKAKSASKSHK